MILVTVIHSHSQGLQFQQLSHRYISSRDKKQNRTVVMEVANVDLKGVEWIKLFLLIMG